MPVVAHEYRPKWAPHVVGMFVERVVDPETGEPDPQVVDLKCEVCGDTHRVECRSGQPREKVAKYALGHVHRDVMR